MKYQNIIKFASDFQKEHGRIPTIAVDFDGCLCTNKYPDIGEPNTELIQALREVDANLILWTCRDRCELAHAVEFCTRHGLKFAAINENIQELKRQWGTNPRKIGADLYIDDKALCVQA